MKQPPINPERFTAVAWRLRLPATVNSGQCFERMTSKTLGYRTSAHSLTSACRSLLPLTARSWCNRRLQPKTAFSRLPPVHRADLKGQLRVDLSRCQRAQEWPLFRFPSVPEPE